MRIITIKQPIIVKSEDVVTQYLIDRKLNAEVSKEWHSLPPMGNMPSILKDQAI